MRKTKRTFVRRDGLLIDDCAMLFGGKKSTYTASAATFGERLAPKKKARLMKAVQAGERGLAGYALESERSPEHLEALLAGLQGGSISAPSQLMPYLDDARVRPALVAAADATTPGDGSNHFQVIGFTGGPGAKDALRRRIETFSSPTRGPSLTTRTSTVSRVS